MYSDRSGSGMLMLVVRYVSGEEDRGRLSSRTAMREGHISYEGPRGAVISNLRAEGDPCICVHIEGGPHPTHG